MKPVNSILDAIGDTALIPLKKIVSKKAATVLCKCEFMNPTGSIKDRLAKYVVEKAEETGLLRPGGVIVENTSGNTGLALAMVAAVKGYRCIFTMPDKMSTEKVNMLKSFGAEVVITPTDVPGDSPQHYVETAKRIARETPNSFYVNQYHSPLNIEAHYHSTAQEVWQETKGNLDYFVAGVGTGGTLSGVGRFFKEKKSKTKIVGVDPLGSVHYHYFYTRTLAKPHVYKVEGIGEDILCGAMDFSVVDEMRQVSDRESFAMARRLVREEGLFCGGSAGAAAHVAVRLAEEVGEGKTIVVILCDSATRYITKHLSDSWMRDHGFLSERAALGSVQDLLMAREQKVVSASGDELLEQVVEKLKSHGISQVPILDSAGQPVGVVNELQLLRALQEGRVHVGDLVSKIMEPVGGLVHPQAPLEDLFRLFEISPVVFVVEARRFLGIISKIDLVDYLTGIEKWKRP